MVNIIMSWFKKQFPGPIKNEEVLIVFKTILIAIFLAAIFEALRTLLSNFL